MLLKTIDSTNPVTRTNKVLPIPEYAAKPAAHQPFSPTDRKIVPDSRFFNTRFDTDTSVFWLSMRPDCPAKFTPELVQAFRDFQHQASRVETAGLQGGDHRVFESRI